MALGIVSFVLVALMGLMSVGLNEARRGREDTLLASMTSYRMTSQLGTGYANLTNGTAYFSFDGLETSPANAYYICKTTVQAPTLSRPELGANALQVKLLFNWPYLPGQPDRTNYPHEQVFTTTVARY